MIGCLTETTTCVVAKPLVYYNVLDHNIDVVVDLQKPDYTHFDFIVDVGSSLGLWLGLSALAIFDNLVECLRVVKNKYYDK